MKQRPRVGETLKVDYTLRVLCLRGLIAHVFKLLTVKVMTSTFLFLMLVLLQNSMTLEKQSRELDGFTRFELP
jgi:hypothetical protein